MLTRCPTCDTAFRITPEQLKARNGQVRCGACSRVFSALETLVEEPPVIIAPVEEATETSPDPTTNSVSVAAEVAETALANEPEPTPDLSAHDALSLISEFRETEEVAPTSSPSIALESSDETHETQLVAPNQESLAAEAPAMIATSEPDTQIEEDAPPSDDAPAEAVTPPSHSEPDAAPIAEPEPVPPEEPEPEPKPLPVLVETVNWEVNLLPPPPPPPQRWPWIVGGLLALVVLGLQVVLAVRVDWAASNPDVKPALTQLCNLMGCEIGLPQKPELIEIETSNMHPDPTSQNRLVLTATLKNRAAFAQRYPHLELTLTDTADKAIARKVLPPTEYLARGLNPDAGMAANADLAVSVDIDSGELVASGYRIYAFYP